MYETGRRYALFSAAILLIAGGFALFQSQKAQSQTLSHALITERIDESRLLTLGGNRRPEAIAANDLGAVADDFPLEHMMLQLQRPAAQEQALDRLIEDLHNPASPNFHKWLTPAEFGRNFGAAQSDIDTVTRWLTGHGFRVNTVYTNGMLIDFSGNAGQVRNTFHTSIHSLSVKGERHFANFSDPQIPAALAPVVAGVVSMHDFRPHKMSRPKYTFTQDKFTYQAVVPADLATIYDFNPLFTGGVTGTGQTIAVIEDTDLYNSSDWSTFRSTFGLSQYTGGSLTTVHPPAAPGGNNCLSPGVNGDDGEAILDTEWASAAAPSAAIVVAACANTTTSGVFIAGANIINESKPPSIISISYGECEAFDGATLNAATASAYQQAVAEGISVFVASGDEGGASCDAGAVSAAHGISISAQAATQYNVAVGGTDFDDSYQGTNAQYWSATNTATYGSAQSYIPEIPWNDSCAGSLIAGYLGYPTAYGANGLCGSQLAQQDGLLAVAAGSGGPSNCFSGVPSTSGVASGSCNGYPKPSWQAGTPADGVRDIPDVSMFASNGFWGHYLVICYSDTSNGGAPCRGAPSGWAGAGGTSFAAPVMAGIQALVNQKTGSSQGNPNPVYYSLAAKVPAVFHNVTLGDITVNCSGTVNCYGYAGNLDYGRGGRLFGTTYGGGLSTSDTSYAPAYQAGVGWNYATGLGSVDANQLVTNWTKGQ